jgi:hypothetical protein
MKIFKGWEETPIEAFVIFLGKEVIVQNRRMRRLYKECTVNGDVNAVKQFVTQSGVAMQTNTIYNIAKTHFNMDSFKRKHIKNEKGN